MYWLWLLDVRCWRKKRKKREEREKKEESVN